MPAKKSVKTVKGVVAVDPEATYALTLAKAVTHLGVVMSPRNRNINVTGAALLIIASTAAEGAIVDAAPV